MTAPAELTQLAADLGRVFDQLQLEDDCLPGQLRIAADAGTVIVDRHVVAARVPYFRALADFQRSAASAAASEVSLPELAAEAVRRLMRFAYTAHLDLCAAWAIETLHAAHYLDIKAAETLCRDYVCVHLSPAPGPPGICVWHAWDLGEYVDSAELVERCRGYALAAFREALPHLGSDAACVERLAGLLRDPALRTEATGGQRDPLPVQACRQHELAVRSEPAILRAVLDWWRAGAPHEPAAEAATKAAAAMARAPSAAADGGYCSSASSATAASAASDGNAGSNASSAATSPLSRRRGSRESREVAAVPLGALHALLELVCFPTMSTDELSALENEPLVPPALLAEARAFHRDPDSSGTPDQRLCRHDSLALEGYVVEAAGVASACGTYLPVEISTWQRSEQRSVERRMPATDFSNGVCRLQCRHRPGSFLLGTPPAKSWYLRAEPEREPSVPPPDGDADGDYYCGHCDREADMPLAAWHLVRDGMPPAPRLRKATSADVARQLARRRAGRCVSRAVPPWVGGGDF